MQMFTCIMIHLTISKCDNEDMPFYMLFHMAEPDGTNLFPTVLASNYSPTVIILDSQMHGGDSVRINKLSGPWFFLGDADLVVDLLGKHFDVLPFFFNPIKINPQGYICQCLIQKPMFVSQKGGQCQAVSGFLQIIQLWLPSG